MYHLENNRLKIAIKHKGAELCRITSIHSDKEFMWQADPSVWGSHAPNLFPIIGMMKAGRYNYKGKSYDMPKHGFVRHNEDFEVNKLSDTRIEFILNTNTKLKIIYPFNFRLKISYELKENTLFVHHEVENLDNNNIYFSLGGHPAFNCPLHKEEAYSDYSLEFQQPEQSESYLLDLNSGLVTDKTKPVFSSANTIKLRPDLFNEDALVFKDLNSKSVSLKHSIKGTVLTLKFDEFDYLGIWGKPNAPYVCIEPWQGIADSINTTQELTEKEGIIDLAPNLTHKATYSIEIDKGHLV